MVASMVTVGTPAASGACWAALSGALGGFAPPEPRHHAGNGRDAVVAGWPGRCGRRRRRSRSWHRRGAPVRRAARPDRTRRALGAASGLNAAGCIARLACAMAFAISPSAIPQAIERGALAADRRLHAAERGQHQRGVGAERRRLRRWSAAACRLDLASLDFDSLDMGSPNMGSLDMVDPARRQRRQSARSNRRRKPTDGRARAVLHRSLCPQTGAVLRRLFLLRRCPVAVFPALAGGARARRAAPSGW